MLMSGYMFPRESLVIQIEKELSKARDVLKYGDVESHHSVFLGRPSNLPTQIKRACGYVHSARSKLPSLGPQSPDYQRLNDEALRLEQEIGEHILHC